MEAEKSQMLENFPFVIKGLDSDNGSEYINRDIAALLQKQWIEFTKSRSRQTNDNALAEGKNAATVRKQFGYVHIPQKWAPQINDFSVD
jgi:NAD(P)H-nitrite reductase large subunit